MLLAGSSQDPLRQDTLVNLDDMRIVFLDMLTFLGHRDWSSSVLETACRVRGGQVVCLQSLNKDDQTI